MERKEILQAAKEIWEYHRLNQQLEKADLILVLGNPDKRTAEYAAGLFLEGLAPKIMFSGRRGNFTSHWDRPEAEIFADIAMRRGVPQEKIILEKESTSTGENILLSKALLEKQKMPVKKVIIVCHPVMERRAYATSRKRWPEMKVIVTSPQISFEECPNEEIPEEELIHVLVGWLQRIKLYAQRRLQIPQEIPQDIWRAYEKLVRAGYTKHLVK